MAKGKQILRRTPLKIHLRNGEGRYTYESTESTRSELPIALIDSGVGGLSVVREVMRELPLEHLVYVADNARFPYGPKPIEKTARFVRRILRFLRKIEIGKGRNGVKLAVLACNTASVAVLPDAEKKNGFPVIGVIQDGARFALYGKEIRRVGLIATRATIESGAYQETLKTVEPDVEIYPMALQRLVNLVEEGRVESTPERIQSIVNSELESLKSSDLDTLILGCTHFTHLKTHLQRLFGPGVQIVDPALATARAVKSLLLNRAPQTPGSRRRKGSEPYRFFTSGDPDRFRQTGSNVLGRPIERVETIPAAWLETGNHRENGDGR